MTARGVMQALYSGKLRSDQIIWKDPSSGSYQVSSFRDEAENGYFIWIGTVYALRMQDKNRAPRSPGYERFLADALAA